MTIFHVIKYNPLDLHIDVKILPVEISKAWADYMLENLIEDCLRLTTLTNIRIIASINRSRNPDGSFERYIALLHAIKYDRKSLKGPIDATFPFYIADLFRAISRLEDDIDSICYDIFLSYYTLGEFYKHIPNSINYSKKEQEFHKKLEQMLLEYEGPL